MNLILIFFKKRDLSKNIKIEVIFLKKEMNNDSWLFGFHGISTFVGYLTLNPLSYKLAVLFQIIQFSMIT